MPLAISTQGAPEWISVSRPNRYTTEWISVFDLITSLRAMSAAKRCHQSYTVVFEAEVSQIILRRVASALQTKFEDNRQKPHFSWGMHFGAMTGGRAVLVIEWEKDYKSTVVLTKQTLTRYFGDKCMNWELFVYVPAGHAPTVDRAFLAIVEDRRARVSLARTVACATRKTFYGCGNRGAGKRATGEHCANVGSDPFDATRTRRKYNVAGRTRAVLSHGGVDVGRLTGMVDCGCEPARRAVLVSRRLV